MLIRNDKRKTSKQQRCIRKGYKNNQSPTMTSSFNFSNGCVCLSLIMNNHKIHYFLNFMFVNCNTFIHLRLWPLNVSHNAIKPHINPIKFNVSPIKIRVSTAIDYGESCWLKTTQFVFFNHRNEEDQKPNHEP